MGKSNNFKSSKELASSPAARSEAVVTPKEDVKNKESKCPRTKLLFDERGLVANEACIRIKIKLEVEEDEGEEIDEQ